MFIKRNSILFFLICTYQYSNCQITLNKTISTSEPVVQISSFSNTVVYSHGNATYAYNYGQDNPQLYYNYAANDISLVLPVGHDTLSILKWGSTLFYGNNDAVFNSNYSFPINYPVKSIGINGDLFNNQLGDTVYVLNSYNVANDQWNVLRISNGLTTTFGNNFYDPELINYLDLDYMQVGINRYIAIIKPNDLMLYNLNSNDYISTGIANITSFQYFTTGGNAYYSVGNSLYRIESISSNIVTSTLVCIIPVGNTINEFSISGNGTIWVAANDGVYSTLTSGVGLEENSKNTVSIYPNPSADQITVVSNETDFSIRIYDLYGKLLKEIPVNTHSKTIDIQDLSVGSYIVTYKSINGMKSQKIIKL